MTDYKQAKQQTTKYKSSTAYYKVGDTIFQIVGANYRGTGRNSHIMNNGFCATLYIQYVPTPPRTYTYRAHARIFSNMQLV